MTKRNRIFRSKKKIQHPDDHYLKESKINNLYRNKKGGIKVTYILKLNCKI